MKDKKQKTDEGKFHRAMAEEQEKIDRETSNPIDVSNADHNIDKEEK